jgi:uncharacterized protein YbjT (DUF2867 family)
MTQTHSTKPRVLLLGATGFIGRHLLYALRAAGYAVTCGGRGTEQRLECDAVVQVDYLRDHAESDWLLRLAGIDFVINAVGILREDDSVSFVAIHIAAPSALFSAAASSGVRKLVQISALGADDHAVSDYHRTKKVADDTLAALQLPWVILQPSLVFGAGGLSAALFTRLAALPLVPLPGQGEQSIQPIHIDDLTAATLRLLETNEFDGQRIPAVGPRPLTLRQFLDALRHGMGLGNARYLRIPMPLVRATAAIGDKLPGVLLNRESLGMLIRGNVASPAAITAILRRRPRPAELFIPPPSARSVANEARLSWLLPLLRATVGLVWIITGVVSLGIYPVADSYDLLARLGLSGAVAAAALYGSAALDLVLGFGVFLVKRRKWLWRAQMSLIVAYSIIIAIYLPEYWVHPYGPLTKNLPMLAAILMLHEFEDRWTT